MRSLVLAATALVLALGTPRSAPAQGTDGVAVAAPAPGTVAVEWLGEVPRSGELAWLLVRPGGRRLVDVRGAIDRAPLLFEPHAGGFVALAPVGLEGPDSVTVVLWLGDADGRVETREARVPVRRRNFPMERLTVAPEFGRPPDSTLSVRLAAEYRRALGVSARALETPRLWEGAFAAPRTARITSAFGGGREFNGQITSRHTGTDFAGGAGDPVHAAQRGVVALVDAFYYGGNVVYVNHGGGLVTAYMHLSETLVQPGDTVVRGQLIGRVGASGRVTGPHLHWMARHGSVTVDAASLLRLPALPTAPQSP